jgi:hypothetical protein
MPHAITHATGPTHINQHNTTNHGRLRSKWSISSNGQPTIYKRTFQNEGKRIIERANSLDCLPGF